MSVFHGVGVATITPFDDNGINFDEFGKILEFLIERKADSLIVCGTTGEPATMSADERRAAIAFAVEKVRGRIPVIAGYGCNSTAETVKNAREAQALGADALLVVTPYYNKCTQNGLFLHYSAVAEAVDIPVIVYNVPSRTGLNMLPETFARLSEHENICGMKEASGNIAQITELARLCGDRIALYSGNDDTTLPVLALGGQGVISVTANILPEQVEHMVEMYMAGDVKGSREMQFYLNEMNHALMSEVNPIPVKTAMRLMGMDMGALRLPLTEMQGERLDELKAVLRKYALI